MYSTHTQILSTIIEVNAFISQHSRNFNSVGAVVALIFCFYFSCFSLAFLLCFALVGRNGDAKILNLYSDEMFRTKHTTKYVFNILLKGLLKLRQQGDEARGRARGTRHDPRTYHYTIIISIHNSAWHPFYINVILHSQTE